MAGQHVPVPSWDDPAAEPVDGGGAAAGRAGMGATGCAGDQAGSPTQPQFVTPGFGLPTGAPLQGLQAGLPPQGFGQQGMAHQQQQVPLRGPVPGMPTIATESTPARDAADAANDARDGTRTTSVPNDAGSAADDDAHAGAQSTANDESPDDAGIYDVQPRMVECAGYDGICSLNWLMDIASCEQR